jgi:sigma-B regulation protein RsbU (phosphoserine phosphatase)
MKRDLEIAREIQLWLVPENPPEVPGLDMAFLNRPANTVAGDYYDVFPRTVQEGAHARNTLLLAVADVAGKSLPAALLMATFQASLKTLSASSVPLLELAAGLNRYACAHSRNGARFTTAFLAECDPDTRQLTYVNAGHNAPVLRRANGSIERLDRGGLPFGIMTDGAYESGTVVLQKGDLVLIFTDGLIEAVNERDEEFGEVRMLASLQAHLNAPAKDMLRAIMSDVNIFVGMTHQHDDITCLLLRAL